jgi:LL-H family phage holin
MDNLNQIINAIMPYVVTIVTAIFAYLAVRIKTKLEEKLNTQAKKEVAEATVNYIQQVYSTLDGKGKLQKALETATEWLESKGIKVSEAEMTILIEAAIKGAKEGWATQKIAENDLIISSAQVQALETETTESETTEETK